MNQIAPTTGQAPAAARFDLMDPACFAHVQRVAQMYAASPLFPAHLRNGGREIALANAVLCMNMAHRQREDTLTVAQNIYFVGGKPGWSATYMIAKANQWGVFKNPIDWFVKGKDEDLEVTAHATLSGTGKKVEVTISFATAKAEGWTSNKKYSTMPEQMLRYRTATALIRLYCPEVMIGLPVSAEIEDENAAMRDVTPYEPHEPDPAPARDVEDAETVEDDAPKARGKVDRTPPAPAAKPEPKPEARQDEKVEAKPAPKTKAQAEEKPAPDAEPEEGGLPLGEPQAKARAKDWQQFMGAVLSDFKISNGDLSGVVGFYGEQLTEMRRDAPEDFAELESQLGGGLAEAMDD